MPPRRSVCSCSTALMTAAPSIQQSDTSTDLVISSSRECRQLLPEQTCYSQRVVISSGLHAQSRATLLNTISTGGHRHDPPRERRANASAHPPPVRRYQHRDLWVKRPSKAFALHECERNPLPHIRSQISYATALHEFGHIKGRHHAAEASWYASAGRGTGRDPMRYLDPAMDAQRQKSLAWYAARPKRKLWINGPTVLEQLAAERHRSVRLDLTRRPRGSLHRCYDALM